MKKFPFTTIPLIAVLLFIPVSDVRTQVLPLTEWWSFFPSIKGCGFAVFPLDNNGKGNLSQSARYVWPVLPANLNGPVVVVADNALYSRHSECGYITISMTVPELVAKTPEHESKKKSRNDKFFEKLAKLRAELQAPTPPPKRIEIKGFEAYKIFGPPSDVDVESVIQTVEVRFANNKQIRIAIYPEYGDPEKLAETIDYAKLSRAMDEYASHVLK